MKKNNYRHGDVLLIPTIDAVKGKQEAELILARGEVTGHAHRITEGEAALFKYYDKTYLRVMSDFALLTHEEHKALQIPQGDYEIKIQNDYEPSGWKKVQD